MDLVITQGPTPPADPTAIIGRRILAYLVDALIITVLVVAAFATMASSAERASALDAQLSCDFINDTDTGYFCISSDKTVILIEEGDIGVLILIGLVYAVAMHLVLPALTGFSPGKALVGLRVVDKETFEKAGFGAHLIRWLLWAVDSAPWCFPLVGLITGLSSNGHRRVGDMGAGTLVIDKLWVGQPMAVAGVNSVSPAAATAVSAAAPPPPTGTPPPPASPPIPTTAPTAPLVPSPSATTPPPPPGATPPPPVPGTAAVPPATPPPLVVPAPEPEPVDTTAGDEPEPTDEPDATQSLSTPPGPEAPTAPPAPTPPAPPVAPPAPSAPVDATPGVDAPQWDAARDTYIQWDAELGEWMEWSEPTGAWIPISK